MTDDETPTPPASSEPPAQKSRAEKAPAKKVAAKKAPARKAAAKKASVKKTPAKKAPAKKAPATEAPVRKSAATQASDEAAADEPSSAPVVAAPVETATGPTPHADRRRRPGLVWLTALVVAVVVVVVVLVFRATGGDDADAPGGTAAGGGVGAVPTPPASAPGRGSFVKSTVAADGTVSVQNWIRSSTQIRDLDVSVYDPEDSGSAQAVDVKVQSLDGQVLARKDQVGSDSVNLKLSTPVPNLYLSYRITGGSDAASQTVQGRMLVTVLGMDVGYSGSSGGVQRLVVGPGTVSNVACLRVNGSADAAPKPCGSPTDDGGWLVSLRGIDRSDRLLAQLESSAS